jgi:hypothetical protein
MKTLRALLIVAAFVLPLVSKAQDSSLVGGRLVRFQVVGDSRLRVGRVDAVTPDSLMVRECVDCARTRFAMSEFQRLEVLRRAPHGPLGGALIGAAARLAVGAVIGATVGAISDAHQDCHQECIHGLGVAIGVIVFGGTGAVAGTFIGAFKGADHWRSVLPPRVVPQEDKMRGWTARFGASPPTAFSFLPDSFSGNGKLSDEDTRKLERSAAEYASKVEFRDRHFTGFDPYRRYPGDSARVFRDDAEVTALAKALHAPVIDSDTLFAPCTPVKSCGFKVPSVIVTIGPPSVNAEGDRATVTVIVAAIAPEARRPAFTVESAMRWVKRGKKWVHVPGGAYGIS